jgi:hypothetical protein
VSGYVLQYSVSDEVAMQAIVDEFVRVLRPGGQLLAIEQVTDGEVGHMMTTERHDEGVASRASYVSAFARSGFANLQSTNLRVSDSRVLRFVARLGRQLPWIPWALMLEARLLRGTPVRNGRYVDTLFSAVVPG